MAQDLQHERLTFTPSVMNHHYGQNVHLVSSPMMLSLLAKLGHPSTQQPFINSYVEMLYSHLFDVVADTLFPKTTIKAETRMMDFYEGEAIDPELPCVTVDLARAGTLPSQVCYNKLNFLLNPMKVRQDHFYVARRNNEKGEVTGVDVSGSKIGGDIDKAIVLFPDPMGATGSTIVEAYHHFKNKVGGVPLHMIAMHLMITPEYLKKVTSECPELKVFALRLDRGLSLPEILRSSPGKFWDKEKGLNQHQYIVPGAGGLGEILNNSYC